MSSKRKICVILVDRANYGRMKPVMQAIKDHPDLELQIIVSGSMVLERFDQPIQVIEQDGFEVNDHIYMELEGSTPLTMAKSVGFAVIEFSTVLKKLDPDLVLLIGDRYEALGAAVSAVYQNLCLAHIQGGEISGSIDESARHAISKFAHYHFPSTDRSADYLVRMGENPATVFNFGCPVGDTLHGLDDTLPDDLFSSIGVGAALDPSQPFYLVMYHPITTEFGQELQQADEILAALDSLRHPTVWLWPNIDAGADHISKCLRRYREQHHDNTWLHLLKNLKPELFQKVLKRSACAIGNSSSFVRDSTFSGTPVVLVGDRQEGREIAENVLPVPCERQAILDAVTRQSEAGRYPPSHLYGTGQAAPRIADQLAKVDLYVQKRLHYPYA